FIYFSVLNNLEKNLELNSFDNDILRFSPSLNKKEPEVDYGAIMSPLMPDNVDPNEFVDLSKLRQINFDEPDLAPENITLDVPDLNLSVPKIPKFENDLMTSTDYKTSAIDSFFAQNDQKSKISKTKGVIVDKNTEIRSAVLRSLIKNPQSLVKETYFAMNSTISNTHSWADSSNIHEFPLTMHFHIILERMVNRKEFFKSKFSGELSEEDAENFMNESLGDLRKNSFGSIYPEISGIFGESLADKSNIPVNDLPSFDHDLDENQFVPEISNHAINNGEFDIQIVMEKIKSSCSISSKTFDEILGKNRSRKTASQLFSNLLSLASDKENKILLEQLAPLDSIQISLKSGTDTF
ncbi:MAG: hypothetical protein MHPSP_002281, partial [Paramarteilia canceri]